MDDTGIHHRSVTELRGMLDRRELSARELLEHYASRIESHNPAVNAVVTMDLDRARAAAATADETTTAGDDRGPLHGIPITVKDALAVAGVRSTGGATELRDHVPGQDADVVAAVRAAGAIPFAKTNVPRWSGDLQTFNDVFGTTNNPWDTTRTPAGSSGGAATSVALGFTGFELGTDIGGSIRVPAAFCGVVGHKPSFGLVPCGGYLDRPDYGWTEPDINVHGPLARSVDDLELVLDLIAGPRPDASHAIRHRVPPARHERIDQYRIAVWSHDDACPPAAEVTAAVELAGDVLARIGARVDRRSRPGFDPERAIAPGWRLLGDATSPSLTDAEYEAYVEFRVTGNHREWLAADVERAKIRATWRAFFGDVDALLCPVTITGPFAHDHTATMVDRTLVIDGVERPHLDLVWWTLLIGMAYLPSTVVPVTTTADGLPLGVQIVGPYLEDRTALAVARALRAELGPLDLPDAPITPGH